MKKEPTTFTKRRWYTPLLIRLNLVADYRRLPIFGIEAAGKTYFAYSLAQFLSLRKFGRPLGAETPFLAEVIRAITAGKPLPATAGNRELKLHLEKVDLEAYSKVMEDIFLIDQGATPVSIDEVTDEHQSIIHDCNILISTNDMSGTEFRNAMRQLSEPHQNMLSDPLVKKFFNIIRDCDGAIVVVDLVRNRGTMVQDELKKMIQLAISEQVVPLMSGIHMAIENRNIKNKVFPLYLIFTKKDIHGMSREALYLMVREVFALLLAQFQEHIKVRIHSVINMGFIESNSYIDGDSEGISFFLADLYACTKMM